MSLSFQKRFQTKNRLLVQYIVVRFSGSTSVCAKKGSVADYGMKADKCVHEIISMKFLNLKKMYD